MGYSFVAASSQRIFGTISDASVVTLTGVANRASETSSQQIIVATDTAAGTARHSIGFDTSRGWAQSVNAGGGSSSAFTATEEIFNQWNAVTGLLESNAPRTVWLLGLYSATQTTGRIVTFNQLEIGARTTSANAGLFMNGKLAEIAVWDVHLTTDEIVSLAKGFKPSRVRPQSLQYYVPLVRDLNEIRAGIALSTSASAPTVTDHPRVY